MSSDWLPAAPAAPPFADWPPWRPRGFRDVDVASLSYLVVDELADGTCVLAVTEWPRTDERGRVRFRLDERPHLVRVAVADLAAFLDEHHAARTRRPRDVRIGDVYAAVARTERLPEPETEAEAHALARHPPGSLDWLEPPVHDLTGEAREAAKVALLGAVAPVLDRKEVRKLMGEGER